LLFKFLTTHSVRAFSFGHHVCRLLSVCVSFACLSRIRSRKLSERGAKFRHLYTKSGLVSKNMTLDFALEVAQYPQSTLNPKIAQSEQRELSKIGTKCHHLYRKSGSLSKNRMSNFAPEVSRYPNSSPKPQNIPK